MSTAGSATVSPVKGATFAGAGVAVGGSGVLVAVGGATGVLCAAAAIAD